MKFSRIQYHNYRCFQDVDVSFETHDDKNITLIVGAIGGGKTEMLFSFHWVLYGFDFKKLRAKGAIPWAINTSRYFALQNGKPGDTDSCSVTLTFEEDGLTYIVKRTEKYEKKDINVVSHQEIELSHKNSNGVKSLPIRDAKDIQNILSRIIPQNILYGIIFDGERMNAINSQDEAAIRAIQGVINQITNEQLFVTCKLELDDIYKSIKKGIQREGGRHNNSNITSIQSQITSLEANRDTLKGKYETNKRKIDEIDATIKTITQQLMLHADSKKLEKERQEIKNALNKSQDKLDSQIDVFYKDLNEAFLFINKELLDNVEDLLDNYDVPAGLTVEAVMSILKRTYCICGNPLCADERQKLKSLITTLPPDNIESTIKEMVRQTRVSSEEYKDKLKRSYAQIQEYEDEIIELKNKYSAISAQIIANSPEELKKLEEQNQKLRNTLAELQLEQKSLPKQIADFDQQIRQLNDELAEVSASNEIIQKLLRKKNIVEKFKIALDKIDQVKKQLSLSIINSKINEAYALLSEDYERGMRLCIIQYDNKLKYSMFSYNDNSVKEYYDKHESERIMWKTVNHESEEQIKEKIILSAPGGSSTGQSKVNTLAFAKAIIDYANDLRTEDSIEITKDYPFLIDSPFSEISNGKEGNSESDTKGSLDMVGKHINTFSHQIIMMTDAISLSHVDKFVLPYVAKTVYLKKDEIGNFSYIE